jgi:hypothetical protein
MNICKHYSDSQLETPIKHTSIYGQISEDSDTNFPGFSIDVRGQSEPR